jgi:hypothetical protein
MTKPVAVFRSGVIEDSMKTAIWCYFPLSAGISPHGRYQPHGQRRHLEVDATGRDRVSIYGWLSVGYHVSGSRGRVGLVTPTPNGHLPALFGGPFHVQLGEWVFVRWVGPLEYIRHFLSAAGRAWWCLFHSTKLLCMKRAIKKVVVIHPQGT